MIRAIGFWQGFLDLAPHKRSSYWSEFKCSNINLGFLWDADFSTTQNGANFVPVFEFDAADLEQMKDLALKLGATVLVDINDHPDKQSYVLLDPLGHEFEVTKFHD
jgi:hypothetical protein